MKRFYIHPDQILRPTPYLADREARHLKTVLRLRCGDRIELFDGTGWEYDARIVSMAAGRVHLRITDRRQTSTEPLAQLTIAQAMLKGRKMDTLIRQLTEIGIHRWQPFIAQRSISRPDPAKSRAQAARWEKITVAAVKQCRRGHPPAVSLPVRFAEALESVKAYPVKLILWEKATRPLSHLLPPALPADQPRIALFLGPEGGFTEAEITAADACGVAPVSLGPRILRAETAALTAAALALHHLDNLG